MKEKEDKISRVLKEILLSFILGYLGLGIFFIFTHPKKINIEDVPKGIVIDKDDDFLLGKKIIIKNLKNNEFEIIRCCGIVYDNINCGDTIK